VYALRAEPLLGWFRGCSREHKLQLMGEQRACTAAAACARSLLAPTLRWPRDFRPRPRGGPAHPLSPLPRSRPLEVHAPLLKPASRRRIQWDKLCAFNGDFYQLKVIYVQ